MTIVVLDPFNTMSVPQQISEKLAAEANNSSFHSSNWFSYKKIRYFWLLSKGNRR